MRCHTCICLAAWLPLVSVRLCERQLCNVYIDAHKSEENNVLVFGWIPDLDCSLLWIEPRLRRSGADSQWPEITGGHIRIMKHQPNRCIKDPQIYWSLCLRNFV